MVACVYRHKASLSQPGSQLDKSSDKSIADISEKEVGKLHSAIVRDWGGTAMDSIMNDLCRISQAVGRRYERRGRRITE